MKAEADWTELARQGRTLEAIVAYRASAGVGLGDAKEIVESWLAVNLPPSADYQRATRIGARVADRLTEYAARTGRELAYIIRVLAPAPADHIGHPAILFAELPEGREGRDLIVKIELTGVPGNLRRQTVLNDLNERARMVWVIEVDDPTIHVATEPTPWSVWHDEGVFDGGDVLPGFSCKVSELFA